MTYKFARIQTEMAGYPPEVKGESFDKAIKDTIGPEGKLLSLTHNGSTRSSGLYIDYWIVVWESPDIASVPWEKLTEMPTEIALEKGRYVRESIQAFFDKRYGEGVCRVEGNTGVASGAILEPFSALGAMCIRDKVFPDGVWATMGYVSAPLDVKKDIQSWWKYIG